MVCYLCLENERQYYMTGYLCEKCLNLQKLISLYGIDAINDISNVAFLRSTEQLETKKNIISKYPIEDIKNKQEEINKEILKKFKKV
jgi:hypothetical protein